MKNLRSKIFNPNGLTVVELLVALTISSIIIIIIFPFFTNGIKNYVAINEEVGLRNEADYIIGSILNEIYLFYPDTVEKNADGTKITLIRSFDSNNKTKFVVDDSTGILTVPTSIETDRLTFELRDNNFVMSKNGVETQINSSTIQIITEEFEGIPNSLITVLDCATERPCQRGTLQVKLALNYVDNENKRNQPLVLQSQFGF